MNKTKYKNKQELLREVNKQGKYPLSWYVVAVVVFLLLMLGGGITYPY